LLPLLALLFVYAVTRTGWQFKIPSLGHKLAALTKPADLRDVFTGTWSLARVQALLTGPTASPRSHAAMVRAEALFTRWYGEGLWTPKAFDRSLQLAVIYPLLWLLAVWVVTGTGRISEVTLFPDDVSWWKRALVVPLGLSMTLVVKVLQARRNVRAPEKLAHNLLVHLHTFNLSSIAFVAGIPFSGSASLAAATGFALAAVVVGAVAGAVAAFVCSAVAVAIAVVGPVTGPNAPSGSGSLIGAFAFFTAVAMGVAYWFLQSKTQDFLRTRAPNVALIWVGGTWAIWLGAAVALAPLLATKPQHIYVDQQAFLLLFFMGLLPVWNAMLDLISVGVTRWLLRRYLRTGNGWAWMFLLDMTIALALAALLFFGVMAILKWMQTLGWGVDAKELIRRFQADPTDPQVTWITWMALTNVLPTLLHLGLGCAGLLGSWLMRDEAFARRLNELREAPVPSPIVGIEAPAKTAASAPMKLAQGLSEPQAAKLLNWVYFDGWLAIAFPFAVAFAVWPLWPRLMTWPLALLVP
jgi:hypothetical protein